MRHAITYAVIMIHSCSFGILNSAMDRSCCTILHFLLTILSCLYQQNLEDRKASCLAVQLQGLWQSAAWTATNDICLTLTCQSLLQTDRTYMTNSRHSDENTEQSVCWI